MKRIAAHFVYVLMMLSQGCDRSVSSPNNVPKAHEPKITSGMDYRMTIDGFWELVAGLPPHGAEPALRARLEKLEVQALRDFQEHFDRLHVRAYSWSLWGAAYIIHGGCSDDGFIDFRYGLISRGRGVFERALANPDSLMDVATTEDLELLWNESLGYVASTVYEKKIGQDIPRVSTERPREPAGERWDFEDKAENAKRLPKLWEKFGH